MGREQRGMDDLTAEQYRALIAETSDVITVIDEDGTVRYQSPSCERVKGWKPAELIGENILEYVHPDDRDRVTEVFTSLADQSGHIEDEVTFRFRTKDDGWIWLAVRGAVPEPDSPIEGYITTSRDVSDRIDYEQQLEAQRDSLDVLNQVLRHDVRNDLQVISAHAELLADQVDQGRDHTETIRTKADHAAELTRTARDMADVMLSSDSDREPVALRSVLERELDEVRSTYPGAAVTVEEELPAVTVRADDMLDSVVRNLLKNAIQHNDKEVPRVSVSVSTDGESVRIRIADNGPGVPDDRKEAIFGKGETGLQSEGTGLGLFLVRTLVDRYGGEVRVEDAEPDGAAFVLDLPRADT